MYSFLQVPKATRVKRQESASIDPMSNAHAVAKQLKSDPTALALLKERNPDLASILLSGDMAQFAAHLEKIKFILFILLTYNFHNYIISFLYNFVLFFDNCSST